MLDSIREWLWQRRAKALLQELSARFRVELPRQVDFGRTGRPGQKAYAYDFEEGARGIVIDLSQHDSFEDVEWSVYHEFRHIMQYGMLEPSYIRRCRSLTRDRNWYLFSPMEIDARVFARSHGEISDMRVFEEIGDMGRFPSAREFLYHCMAVSRKYDVG